MSILALSNVGTLSVSNDARPPAVVGQLEQAYQASLPEMMAIAKERLDVVNFDIPTAFTKALGAESWLSTYRKRVAELPGFDIGQFDRLTQYAKAMMYAHAEYLAALKGPADIDEQLEAARKWSRIVRADIEIMLARDWLPAHVRKVLKVRRGHLGAISNLMTWVSLVRRYWPSLVGKTTLSEADLLEAECVVEQLMAALAHRKRPLRDLKELAEVRQRAFTLFTRAYSQVRRALQYLCWETSQANRLPTLYPRRRRARPKAASGAGNAANDGTVPPDRSAPSQPQENTIGGAQGGHLEIRAS